MPEFLRLLPPDEARALLLQHLARPTIASEVIETASALDRVTAEDIIAPHPLPEFPRSTVDGFAVRARDTFGASDSQPVYLTLVGEVQMGDAPAFVLDAGQCAMLHTGGMLPDGADAAVMLEHTERTRSVAAAQEGGTVPFGEIEILKAIAVGENVIGVGEDVAKGQTVISRGTRLRPAEIGGLMALGITSLRVAKKTRVGLVSSGDEVVDPKQRPRRGQVRDVNAYSLAALVGKWGGEPVLYGIVKDELPMLRDRAARALGECDVVVITAGSSASTRDMTAEVIGMLGTPGVLVHGINTRPGKPTILGVCGGKPVIGLPGNPVSALVNGYLFVAPVIERLLGLRADRPRPSVAARLTINLPSQAGREDWIPVKLISAPVRSGRGPGDAAYDAEPIFGKSNLIFTLAAAAGLLRIPPEATGLSAGELVEVMLI